MFRSVRHLGYSGFLALACCWPALASAQSVFQRPNALPAPGRDAVGSSDTTAVVMNPAVLGFLPGGEFRWTGVFLNESSQLPQQGHAFALGLPIPFLRLGTVLRMDFVNPPDSSGFPSYRLLNWGAGVRVSDASAIGVAWQHSYSDSRVFHSLDAWALGFVTRPWDVLGLGIWGRAINAPVSDGYYRLDPSFELALSIRPLGDDRLEIGLMNQYIYPEYLQDYFVPRASLGIKIPGFGQVRGDIAYSDPDNRTGYRAWLATAGVAVNFNSPYGSTEVGAGTLVGNAHGHDSRYKGYSNLYFDAAVRIFRSSAAIETPHVALKYLIESTPSTREHVALLRKLWAVADEEDSVDAVVLELRDSPARSLAYAQELRDAVQNLRAHGKRVLCHLDDAKASALYVCSSADRILIHPAGGIRFAGLSSTRLYFKGLLDKLGVRADFVRIGDHKSAPESFMREGPTDVARKDAEQMLAAINQQVIRGIAESRRMTETQVAEQVAKGPFVSSEAQKAGFVDRFAYSDQIEDEVAQVLGHTTPVVDEPLATREHPHFDAVRKIALLYVEGDMIDGKSQSIPIVNNKMVGSSTIAQTLRELRTDPSIGAIVLRIESPGGSALAADTIWREIQLTNAAGKPVVVSMGGVAASGGYYVASPAVRIFANPATVTGSIGVFYGKADVAGLLQRIGVNTETYKTAPHADAESMFRPFTDEERAELQHKVAQFYETFLNRVSLGRNMQRDAIDAVGQGRVFTGEQALSHHLIDELGGLRQALKYARTLARLSEHAPIAEYPPPDSSLIARLLGVEAHAAQTQLPLPKQLLEAAKALAPFVMHDPDQPMARLEWVALPQ